MITKETLLFVLLGVFICSTVIISVLNFIIYLVSPRLKFLFTIFTFIASVYFFIQLIDSPHSMEGIGEFIVAIGLIGVGIGSWIFTNFLVTKFRK